ncbi:TRAP transporter substrate-binding protein [Aquamicrobium sp. LC103]|uniref:TRAP transporter substrate-binding protein n=1 Tax=Aquamicrobium sp. LC103 TaxID=1120658 RepID=UPI00063EB1B6|nr:TRAP transporter substrate-binding protein [Aquamicrobium sp. LC103]TKT82420.1 TRAP transporter substrate-binding protein [Aquamicrobium sp. LC103]
MKLKSLFLATVALGATVVSAHAQEITLRLHQFLPPQATIPANAIKPWAEKVQSESGGQIKIEQYDAMSLGGTPPQLVDQLVDGVVDIVWTVIGYTPGRFPTTEAFELPFMVTTGEATSKAFHEYCEKHCADEFTGIKVIAWHGHGPGLIHSKRPVEKLEDMKGLKIRGGSRVINEMLEALGATPVGMPVPAVTEALSKGVIDATTIPWEVTPSLKVSELVGNHTGFSGGHGLYTQTFLFGMNQASYDRLPDNLKAVIDANSGIETAAMFGRTMDAGDKVGLKIAEDRDNKIVTLDEAETKRWHDTAAPLIDAWVEEMSAKGLDAAALVEDAQALIDKHTGM